jgi:hypothetical protein
MTPLWVNEMRNQRVHATGMGTRTTLNMSIDRRWLEDLGKYLYLTLPTSYIILFSTFVVIEKTTVSLIARLKLYFQLKSLV